MSMGSASLRPWSRSPSASASSSASLRIGDRSAMVRMCPSFRRSRLRDGRRIRRVNGNVAAISLGRSRLSRRPRWSLDRCLLNRLERTCFEVGTVDRVMVIFLWQARRRMVGQWDSRDLMFSDTYNGRNRQARSSFVAVVRSSSTMLVLEGCSEFSNHGEILKCWHV